jgi:acetyl-CoA carboxylase carboxyl transferase subunit alpha
MAARMKMYLTRTLRELVNQPPGELLEARYQRFRKLGVFLEEPVA